MHTPRRPSNVLVAVTVGWLLVGPLGDPSGATPAQTDPEASPHVATPVPPPDPEEDIDPVRAPSHGEGISLTAEPLRPIRFPLRSYSSYVDTFGACRDGCTRFHQGIDIFTPKLTPIIAAADGHVTWLRTDASGTAGNGVGITDSAGWRYLYLHINNDTPGTDDGRNPAQWRFIPGLAVGTKVYAGQAIGYSGDSGNAEGTPSHLHFEMRHPNMTNINPYNSLRNASWAPPVPRLFRFDRLGGGTPDDHLAWATTGTRDIMSCDTNGNGTDEPVFRHGPDFMTANSAASTRVAHVIRYGRATDRGFCGDWDGNGTETPGVRRGNLFLLRNSWTSGAAQIGFAFGRTHDRVVVGDWDGNGVDTLGVFRSGRWLLTNRHAGGTAPINYSFGRAGDSPIPGDWNADGVDTAGVWRNTNIYLRERPGGGPHGISFRAGLSTDWIVSGRWSTGSTDGDTISMWRRRPP